jgi:hemerythrin superfamily protein
MTALSGARRVHRTSRMKDTTNALELLRSQHEEVDELIASIERAEGDHKTELFRELADKLAAHSEIEEKLFYPSVKAEQTEDRLLESVEEHLQVKRLLADMLELDCDDEEFDAKLSVMKEEVRHHAHDEEEGKLFPQVKKLFSEDELDGLGGELLAMFEELLVQEPRTQVPMQTEHAARL